MGFRGLIRDPRGQQRVICKGGGGGFWRGCEKRLFEDIRSVPSRDARTKHRDFFFFHAPAGIKMEPLHASRDNTL